MQAGIKSSDSTLGSVQRAGRRLLGARGIGAGKRIQDGREVLSSVAGLQDSIGSRLRPASVQAGDEGEEGAAHPRAACSSLDASLFFGDHLDLREEPKTEKIVREELALGVCEECEVRWTCLMWSLDNEEEYGVWGGMTAPERKDFMRYLKRRKKRMENATDLKATASKWIEHRRR
jgi:WhiB family transcriptional regulator, redox-sensing transcriptional regulator